MDVGRSSKCRYKLGGRTGGEEPGTVAQRLAEVVVGGAAFESSMHY
jgi:hypothetical protein